MELESKSKNVSNSDIVHVEKEEVPEEASPEAAAPTPTDRLQGSHRNEELRKPASLPLCLWSLVRKSWRQQQ